VLDKTELVKLLEELGVKELTEEVVDLKDDPDEAVAGQSVKFKHHEAIVPVKPTVLS